MIVIFAGAGASKAVNPTKYPTTIEFFQNLPDNIKSDLIFSNLESYLRNNKPKSAPIDIEEILWAIYELEDFTNAITNKENLIGWFLNDLKLFQSLGAKYDINPLIDVSRELVRKASELSKRIDEQVYSFYAESPNLSDLQANWLPLLRNLGKRKEQIEIFTTNYDVVIETAIDILSQENNLANIKTGRVNTVQPYLDTTLWEEQKDNQQNDKEVFGLLTKLHGSIDWSRNVNTIYVGTPLYTGDPGKHVILYPGYKGGYYSSNNTTQKRNISFGPPINMFHQHFEKTLGKSDVLIFIGFAFRDNHINELIVNKISPNATVYIIDPREKIENITIPAKKTIHIKKGFDENAVQELLDSLA